MLERNKIISRWCILVHNKKLWTIVLGIGTKQEQIPFLATMSGCLRIFRIARGYLLHSLIFPHSLRIFKDFWTQITNTAVFAKIFIFQKWVLFPIWYVRNFHEIIIIWVKTCVISGKFNINQYWGSAALPAVPESCLRNTGVTSQWLWVCDVAVKSEQPHRCCLLAVTWH